MTNPRPVVEKAAANLHKYSMQHSQLPATLKQAKFARVLNSIMLWKIFTISAYCTNCWLEYKSKVSKNNCVHLNLILHWQPPNTQLHHLVNCSVNDPNQVQRFNFERTVFGRVWWIVKHVDAQVLISIRGWVRSLMNTWTMKQRQVIKWVWNISKKIQQRIGSCKG